MARPKKKPVNATAKKPKSFKLDPDIWEALEAYIAATSPAPSRTATFKTALTEFLAKKGFWPYRGGIRVANEHDDAHNG